MTSTHARRGGPRRTSARTCLAVGASVLAALAAAAGAQPPASQTPSQTPPASQQPSEVRTTITSGDIGAPPRLAVPDFIARSNDAETQLKLEHGGFSGFIPKPMTLANLRHSISPHLLQRPAKK